MYCIVSIVHQKGAFKTVQPESEPYFDIVIIRGRVSEGAFVRFAGGREVIEILVRNDGEVVQDVSGSPDFGPWNEKAE